MNPYNLPPTQVLRGMTRCLSPTPAPVLLSSSRGGGAQALPILLFAQHLFSEAVSALELGGAWCALPAARGLAFTRVSAEDEMVRKTGSGKSQVL